MRYIGSMESDMVCTTGIDCELFGFEFPDAVLFQVLAGVQYARLFFMSLCIAECHIESSATLHVGGKLIFYDIAHSGLQFCRRADSPVIFRSRFAVRMLEIEALETVINPFAVSSIVNVLSAFA